MIPESAKQVEFLRMVAWLQKEARAHVAIERKILEWKKEELRNQVDFGPPLQRLQIPLSNQQQICC